MLGLDKFGIFAFKLGSRRRFQHGLSVTLPACAAFLRTHPDARLLLVGEQTLIQNELHHYKLELSERCQIIHASEIVEMHEAVETALRRKKDSSMRVAINQVKDGQAHAVVSAGNTGALMAIARFVLKTLDGIDRPAIASIMPSMDETGTVVLDLGANVDCTAEHLQQFALMGSSLVAATMAHATAGNHRVGLLNIGHEDMKGNEVVKAAGELLKQTPIHFIGNVAGNQIFTGGADVIVWDGFVGNVLPKTSEGLSQMARQRLTHEFKTSTWRKLTAVVALPAINGFKRSVDNRPFNGAALLGLRGVVIKSHGGADSYAFGFALQRAYNAVAHDMLAKTTAMLAQVHR